MNNILSISRAFDCTDSKIQRFKQILNDLCSKPKHENYRQILFKTKKLKLKTSWSEGVIISFLKPLYCNISTNISKEWPKFYHSPPHLSQ